MFSVLDLGFRIGSWVVGCGFRVQFVLEFRVQVEPQATSLLTWSPCAGCWVQVVGWRV